MTKDKGFLERAEFTLDQELKAILELKKSIQRDLVPAVKILNNRKGKIVLTGVGKSGHIGMKISATLVSLGNQAVFLHPVEAIHGDIGVVSKGDVVIALSFSGGSIEVIRIVKHLKKEFSVKVISITGNIQSQLSKISDTNILLNIQEEGSPHGLAPMASTTTTLVVGDMLASAITSPKNFKKSHFAKFHPGGSLGLELKKVGEFMTVGRAVPTVREDTSFQEMLIEMNDKKLGVVAVLKKKKLIGVVTDGDVRRFLAKGKNSATAKVQDVMTTNPRYVQDQNSLKSCLVMMEDYRITSLFVLDIKKSLIGLIHIHDIVDVH